MIRGAVKGKLDWMLGAEKDLVYTKVDWRQNLAEAVVGARNPGANSTNPSSHGDPECRAPVCSCIVSVRIVLVVHAPADGSCRSAEKRQREEKPSESAFAHSFEGLGDSHQNVQRKQTRNTNMDQQSDLGRRACLPAQGLRDKRDVFLG